MINASHARIEQGPVTKRALNWLIVALTLTILPHLEHLPWWLGALYVAVTVWRWSADRGQVLPARWLLLVMTLATVGAVLFHYRTLFGRDAGVALLTAMMALKILELRTLRDGMVLITLGYFLSAASLLYTQGMPMVGYLSLTVCFLLAAQVMIQPQHAAIPAKALMSLCGRMLLESIPIVLVLFVLFPRISGPLWGIPKDAHEGLTGLSDSMMPGTISKLGQSDKVAFRVRFDDAVPAPDRLYWRGPVLWRFDGKAWTRGEETLNADFGYAAIGVPVSYTVIMEPHGKRWLFALDLPAGIPPEAGITKSFQLLRKNPVNEVLRYEMRSSLDYRTPILTLEDRLRNLQLPPRGNPQARALVLQWKHHGHPAEGIIRAGLSLFHERPFYYTLQPPLLKTDNVVDEFLFTTRQGFCEHFASSFVFLMRAAGVPSRVVTGYQGGELNALGDYLIVRQSDAHAWAEVWLEGRGWARIDPTAAVAPNRVEQGLYAAVPNPETLPFLARRDFPWLRNLALGWDSMNNAWNEWVLAYGPERQREFLSGLGFGPVDWKGMTVAMLLSLAVVGVVVMGLRRLYQHTTADPVKRAYHLYCSKLARRGLSRLTQEGPIQFAERVAVSRPDLAVRARLIARLYAHIRFGRANQNDLLPQLRRLVREFKA